jgi:hypothetical protein
MRGSGAVAAAVWCYCGDIWISLTVNGCEEFVTLPSFHRRRDLPISSATTRSHPAGISGYAIFVVFGFGSFVTVVQLLARCGYVNLYAAPDISEMSARLAIGGRSAKKLEAVEMRIPFTLALIAITGSQVCALSIHVIAVVLHLTSDCLQPVCPHVKGVDCAVNLTSKACLALAPVVFDNILAVMPIA